MKVIINNDGNLYNKLRTAGYHPDKIQRSGYFSFSRSIFNTKYPRFHVYHNIEKKETNIHLDHKAPRYKNAPDHGAEYEGDLIEKEVERIKSFFD